jgi:hypothetical protein
LLLLDFSQTIDMVVYELLLCKLWKVQNYLVGVSMLEGSYLGGPDQLVRSPGGESSVDAVMCEVHRDLLFISYIVVLRWTFRCLLMS